MGSPTSNPRVNVSILPAAIVDAFEDRRDLIVGQKRDTGSAADGVLVQDVHTLTRAQIEAQFGIGELYYRVLNWIDGNGGFGSAASPLDVIPVDDAASATAATAVVTLTGNATAAGTVTISLVDEKLFTLNVAVTSGQTPTQIGDAIVAAVNNLTRPVFSAANVAGVVTFTALDLGTIANLYGIKVSDDVAGTTVTLTNDWASGTPATGTPTVTSIFDVVSGTRYTGISWPEDWSAQLSVVTGFLDPRFNATNAILDGVAFHGLSATFANAQSTVSPLNSQSLVVGGNNLASSQPAILHPPDWALANFMGIRARRLTPGAPIADQIVTTQGRLDAFGGPSMASLPYFNTPLDNVPVTPPADLYTGTEQVTLEAAGFTTFGVNIAGNAMIMGPVVTTWTTDSAGNENDSFLYLNFVDTASAAREIMHRTLRATFAQSRLTEGTLIPGRSMANPASIKAEVLRIYRVLADAALVQAGSEAEGIFSRDTVVAITGGNLANRSVTITGPLPIVTQLGVINYSLQLSFTLGETGTAVTF